MADMSKLDGVVTLLNYHEDGTVEKLEGFDTPAGVVLAYRWRTTEGNACSMLLLPGCVLDENAPNGIGPAARFVVADPPPKEGGAAIGAEK